MTKGKQAAKAGLLLGMDGKWRVVWYDRPQDEKGQRVRVVKTAEDLTVLRKYFPTPKA